MHGQRLDIDISYYKVQDGLSQGTVRSIIEDPRGYIWAGTSDGLNKFDGYKFEVYKPSESYPNNIAGKTNFHFFIDDANFLWVAHHKGISRYNHFRDHFDNILTDENLPNDSRNYIIAVDDGILIAWLDGRGLIRLATKTGKLLPYPNPISPQFLPKGIQYAVSINHNTAYIANSHEVFLANLQTGKCQKMGNFSGITSLSWSNKRLIISTTNTPKDEGPLKGLYEVVKKPYFAFKDGTIAQLDNNLHLFDIPKGTEYTIKLNEKVPPSCITKDHAGNFWLGTELDGLIKISPVYKMFSLAKSLHPGKDLNQALCVIGDTMYIGLYAQGLQTWIKNRDALFEYRQTWKGEKHFSVLGIADAGNNQLWILSGSELFLYHRKTQQAKKVTYLLKDIFGTPGVTEKAGLGFINNMDGETLLSCGKALVKITNTVGRKYEAKLLNTFHQIPISCAKDGSNRLWVGTIEGLYIATQDGKYQLITAVKKDNVKHIQRASNGDMYVSTTTGLYRMSQSGKVIHHFDKEDGLPNEYIYASLEDKKNKDIRISHNNGLSRINTSSLKIINYHTHNGLQSEEFNANAFFQTPDGTIFFGGNYGINYFLSSKTAPKHTPIQTIIQEIKLFEKPLVTDTACAFLKEVTLPYNQNFLSFSFAAMDFTNPNANQYAYRMVGLDKDWIIGGKNHDARYPNLAPGTYTFQVTASNSEDFRSPPTEIRIVILPPFWQKWWFILLSIVIILTSIWYGAKRYFQRKHQEQLAEMRTQIKLLEERKRISRDLHDHVGSQLSYIISNIDSIKKSENAPQLRSVNQTAKDAIAHLRETIWSLSKETITLEDFGDRIRKYAQQQVQFQPQIDLIFKHHVAKNITISPLQALHLLRICQEALNNTLKYAEATQLVILVSNSDECQIAIKITDNGKGFDTSNTNNKESYGLQNMAERAKEIGATFTIQSDTQNGTEICVCLPTSV